MNAKDEDAQRGQMLREYQDSERTLGCIQDKLDQYGQVFGLAQIACREGSNSVYGIDGDGDNLALNFLSESRAGYPYVMPKPSELAALLEERRELQERRSILGKRLGLT